MFVWDHLGFAWGMPSGDPWVILAAVAQATTRLKVGTAITPVPRRRPQVLASTVATLDLLSGGRVVFGAGLGGVPEEFTAFGESSDARERAERLDEGLDLLGRLWAGEKVTHQGSHYVVDGVTLAPLPVQRPRVPVWVGGDSRPALRRAARWDGWVMGGADERGQPTLTPEEVAEKVAYIHQHRTAKGNLDIAITGWSEPGDTGDIGRVEALAEAGATWWLESLHGYRGTEDALLARVEAGPPEALFTIRESSV